MSRPRRRVRVMPAIREESRLKTSRIPVHIIPPGAQSRGPLARSMVIQTLPEEPSKPPPKVTPSNRYHDNVEQVVADYLHFSKYGKVLPVTHGYAPLACHCCSDRNRENMQRQRDRFRALPPDPDPDKLPEALTQTESNPETRRPEENDPSPRRPLQTTEADLRNFPASWMDYQPMPYARTYLNSEFNRASMLQRYEEDRKQYDDASMEYISGRVLDANTKYDLAMKKLELSLNKFSVSREESDLSYE